MKIFGIFALIFVLTLLVGCTQTVPPIQTPPTNNPTVPGDNTPGTTPTEPTPPVPQATGISLSALSTHDSQSDCWISYKGKVYDITTYVPKHPGGPETITPYCGTAAEFESAFTDQHGTSQVSKLVEQGKFKGELQ